MACCLGIAPYAQVLLDENSGPDPLGLRIRATNISGDFWTMLLSKITKRLCNYCLVMGCCHVEHKNGEAALQWAAQGGTEQFCGC